MDEATQEAFDRVVTELVKSMLKKSELGQSLERLGYVMVPREATQAMVEGACSGLRDDIPDLPCGHDIGWDGARAIWRVMIEASQKEGK